MEVSSAIAYGVEKLGFIERPELLFQLCLRFNSLDKIFIWAI
jgi:hypothetical protein